MWRKKLAINVRLSHERSTILEFLNNYNENTIENVIWFKTASDRSITFVSYNYK